MATTVTNARATSIRKADKPVVASIRDTSDEWWWRRLRTIRVEEHSCKRRSTSPLPGIRSRSRGKMNARRPRSENSVRPADDRAAAPCRCRAADQQSSGDAAARVLPGSAGAARARPVCPPRSRPSATPPARSCWSVGSTTATGSFPAAGSRSARRPARRSSGRSPRSPGSRSNSRRSPGSTATPATSWSTPTAASTSNSPSASTPSPPTPTASTRDRTGSRPTGPAGVIPPQLPS